MKKYEKLTLITAVQTYWDNPKRSQEVSALDEIILLIEKHSQEVTILDYSGTDLELKELPKIK